ncbi:hypothetical protein KM043_011505 [Ampulex compressa]|nr:hypothetical protein KM043_011505 [Ampulex compressa]
MPVEDRSARRLSTDEKRFRRSAGKPDSSGRRGSCRAPREDLAQAPRGQEGRWSTASLGQHQQVTGSDENSLRCRPSDKSPPR